LFNEYITTNGYVVCINFKILPEKFAKIIKEENYHKLSLEQKYNVLKKYQNVLKKTGADDSKGSKGSKGTKKRVKDVTNLIEKDFTRILGLDPGNRSLFTCVDKNDIDDKNKKYGKILKCESKEYKHLTGDKNRTKAINKRKDRVPVLKELGSNVSLKTGNYEKHKESLKTLLSLEEKVLKEYQRLWYRKIDFTGYQKKQKAFKILADRLQGNHQAENVLIGWGDGAGSGNHLKGTKMPGKGFKSYIERNTKMVVLDIDENLTSKMCSKCHEETKKMFETKDLNTGKRRSEKLKEERIKKERERIIKEKERIEKLVGDKIELKIGKTLKKIEEMIENKKEYEVMIKKVDVYGVKQCVNCGIKWDRDVNASENILKLLLCRLRKEERPTYLCRKPKPSTEKLESPVLDSQDKKGGVLYPVSNLQITKKTLSIKKKTQLINKN